MAKLDLDPLPPVTSSEKRNGGSGWAFQQSWNTSWLKLLKTWLKAITAVITYASFTDFVTAQNFLFSLAQVTILFLAASSWVSPVAPPMLLILLSNWNNFSLKSRINLKGLKKEKSIDIFIYRSGNSEKETLSGMKISLNLLCGHCPVYNGTKSSVLGCNWFPFQILILHSGDNSRKSN